MRPTPALAVAEGPSLSVSAIPTLDGWRAISILIVVASHMGLGHLIPGGLGVTIFFFLSGYLITSLMLEEARKTGHLNIPHFYARRFLRLMPPLFVTLAVAYGLVGLGVLGGHVTLKGLVAQIFYFSNYYIVFFDPGNTVPDGMAPLWSLAVEEHFYIAYPFLFSRLGRRMKRRQLALVFAAVCIVVLAWRLYLVGTPGITTARTYFTTDTRLDSILWGCIFALLWNPSAIGSGSRRSTTNYLLFSLGVLAHLSALIYRNPDFRETFRYSIQGIGLMPIFFLSISRPTCLLSRFLEHPILQWIGRCSYSIYLIHSIIVELVTRNFPFITPPLWLGIVVFAISAGYSYLLDMFVEPYFRRLRSQFRPSAAHKTSAPQVSLGQAGR